MIIEIKIPSNPEHEKIVRMCKDNFQVFKLEVDEVFIYKQDKLK